MIASTSQPLLTEVGRHRPRHSLWGLSVTLLLCLTVVLGSVGGSYALWNGAAKVDAGSVHSGSVSATTTLTPALTYTYSDNQRFTTSGVSISNTGNVPAQFQTRVTLEDGSSEALAQAVQVLLWETTDVATCTASATPSSPSTTFLAALLDSSTTPLSSELAPGGASGYCLRTSMDVSRATGIVSGDSVTPVFVTTATVGATWTATASATSTQTFVDDISPTAPDGLSANHVSPTTTQLSWTTISTDNVGVTAYRVSRDGTGNIVGTSVTASFLDTIEARTTHRYQVQAGDAAGNWSEWSPEILVDRQPPSTPELTVSGPNADIVTLTFSATDDIGVTAYDIYKNDTFLETVETSSGSVTDEVDRSINNRYYVLARDAAGNVSLPSEEVIVESNTFSTGVYTVMSQTNGFCVALEANEENEVGDKLVQANCDSSQPTQRWHFVGQDDGTFHIFATVDGSTGLAWKHNLKVKTDPSKNSDWTVTRSPADGSFTLKAHDKCIMVRDGKSNIGEPFRSDNKCRATDANRFVLTRLDS